jgi:hypothetical protein
LVIMPTINQLCNFIRKPKMRRSKTPALQSCAQKRGTCVRVFTKTPKKPNSAIRKVARVKLSNILLRSFCNRENLITLYRFYTKIITFVFFFISTIKCENVLNLSGVSTKILFTGQIND